MTDIYNDADTMYQSYQFGANIPPLLNIEPPQIEDYEKRFVAPAQCERIAQTLKDEHLLLLWGEDGVGKEAIAWHLFHLLSQEDKIKKVLHLREQEFVQAFEQLAHLTKKGWEAQHALFVEAKCPCDQSELKSVFPSLPYALKKNNAYLVVGIQAPKNYPIARLSQYSERITQTPSHQEVLFRHLYCDLARNLTSSEEYWILSQIKLTPPSQSMQELSARASVFAEEIRTGRYLLAHMSLPTTPALAVTNLAEPEALQLLALALMNSISESELETVTKKLLGICNIDASSYALDALIKRELWGIERIYPEDSSPLIGFRDEERLEEVKEALWTRLAEKRSYIVDWLKALGEEAKRPASAYASEAIASLILQDCNKAQGVLLAWSKSPLSSVREVAGVTWGQIWSQPQNYDSVCAIMKEWSESGVYEQCWTLLEFLEGLVDPFMLPLTEPQVLFVLECLDTLWKDSSLKESVLQEKFTLCLNGLIQKEKTLFVLEKLKQWFVLSLEAASYEGLLRWNRLLTELMGMDVLLRNIQEPDNSVPTICLELARGEQNTEAFANVLLLAFQCDEFFDGSQRNPLGCLKEWIRRLDVLILRADPKEAPETDSLLGTQVRSLKRGVTSLFRSLLEPANRKQADQNKRIVTMLNAHLRMMESDFAKEILNSLFPSP